MTFQDWLLQTKVEKIELSDFIIKISPFFTENGFNGLEFERKVKLGVDSIDKKIDESLKNKLDVKP